MNALYLLIWNSFKVKVHFDGSDAEPSKKVTVIYPTFYIKNDDQIQDLGEAIEQNNLQSSSVWRVA